MKASLSVLLPVHNAQSTVGADTGRLLEILPELTNRFEIIVIDDGSTDATCEVADDWARHYPQVRFFPQAARVGWLAAAGKLAWRARGEFLMLLCGSPVDAAQIASVWNQRESISPSGSARTANADGRTLRIDAGKPGRAVKSARSDSASVNILSGLGIHAGTEHGQVLLVHRYRLTQLEQAITSLSPLAPAEQSIDQRSASRGAKRPNFLSRIRSFALGE